MNKHIYYIDNINYIIREGYIANVEPGWNHNISIFNTEDRIIDVSNDSYIFDTLIEANNTLKNIIEIKYKENLNYISKIIDLNKKLLNKYEKLLNNGEDNNRS